MLAAQQTSLHSLSSSHPWLLTHPLFWTARHLNLFNCHFHQVDVGNSNITEPQVDQHNELAEQWSRVFARTFALVRKYCTLANLLESEGSPLYEVSCHMRSPPAFFFANRPIERLNSSFFHVRPDHPSGKGQHERLVVGYFHYDTLTRKRRERLSPCPHPHGGHNGPVQRLYQRRLSRITPTTWSQDPYLVCILLSMAQSLAREARSPKPMTFTARLLVTTKLDLEFVHLFEADISSELLDILDQPTLNMTNVSWPIIKHAKISFLPYNNLQQRIMNYLLDVKGSHLESMGGDDVGAPEKQPKKRKIEAESDISRRVKLKG
ncbi:hypothetical protein FDECE_16423 [Fusarium decemcellulare]|nr:hypothetical protein FDECE_16423 [Fusarium decemcellulare]